MKRRRFAIITLLATVAFFSVAGVAHRPTVRASEVPPPLEECLGNCPPARPRAAPPAELTVDEMGVAPVIDMNRAASELLSRIATVADAAAEALARMSEQSAAETSGDTKRAVDPQGLSDFAALPLGYLTFVPCHEYKQGILHEYDPDVQAIFAPRRLEMMVSDQRLEPLKLSIAALEVKSATRTNSAAELASDERHSTGHAAVLKLNETHEGLREAIAPVEKKVSAEMAGDDKVRPRDWFEDYTFGYEYDPSFLALETYLAMQQVFALQTYTNDDELAMRDGSAGRLEYFETVIDGPTRYVFLRTGSARREAALAAKAAREEAEADRERLRNVVNYAARLLNDLGTTLIYVSCDVHTVAERLEVQPLPTVRTARDGQPGLGR